MEASAVENVEELDGSGNQDCHPAQEGAEDQFAGAHGRESVVSWRPTTSMTGHCLPLSPVKRILPCLFAVALLGAACGGDSPGETSDATSAAKTQEPAGVDWPLRFSGGTVDGAQFNSGDYAGQDLVLWFWAPW